MRGLIALAERENRDMSPAEADDFNEMERELRRLAPRTQVRENATGAGTVEYRIGAPGVASFREWRANWCGRPAEDDPEARHAFYGWLTEPDLRHFDPAEYRALSKATGAAGAYLVPTDMANEVVRTIRHQGPVARLARTLVTSAGETLSVPANTAHGVAVWTAENASYTPSDETFAQVALNAFKATSKTIVSEERLFPGQAGRPAEAVLSPGYLPPGGKYPHEESNDDGA